MDEENDSNHPLTVFLSTGEEVGSGIACLFSCWLKLFHCHTVHFRRTIMSTYKLAICRLNNLSSTDANKIDYQHDLVSITWQHL